MMIRFKMNGESPDIGDFAEGEERNIIDEIAKVFIARGLAEEIKSKKITEVEHGRQ
ncbi:MAG: hypothetical protein HY880_05685 [Deltaproteobacteria bacterium]|nr:hypothetical protein [Deltaproteobacteria bacterium]